MPRKQISLTNIIWRLLLALAIALPAAFTTAATDVKAGGGGPIPIIGLILGVDKRNKVYRTANSFIKEKTEYYDGLRDTARQQLLDRSIVGLRDSQVAAYIKVVELIENERQAMYGFAESEKKAARDEFIHTLQEEIKGRLLASTPATQLLGALTNSINSSQGLIGTALDKINGGGGGVLGEIQKVKKIAERMTIAGGLIGGNFGKAIQKMGGDVVGLVNRPIGEIEAGLIKVQGELGEMGDYFTDLENQGMSPRVSRTTKDVVISLVTGEQGDPAIAAIVDMLVAKHGKGGDFRDRARDIMLGNASARCTAKVEQIRAVLYKLEFEPAAEDSSDLDDFPTCEAIDLTALVEEVAASETNAGDEESPATDPEPSQPSQSGQTDTSPPPDPSSDTSDSEPFTSTAEYIWVLTSTDTNPTNEKTAFYGGGQDPTYFAEPRFAGKSVVFGCSANNFTVHDVDVDHEYEYHNVTVGVDFDSPPARLDPGQEVELKAFASSSGTVNEGGVGSGVRFQYSLNNNTLEPILGYFPWAANSEGTSTGTWSFSAPGASEGGEFSVTAGLWNVPPCHTIWTYQALANENAPAQTGSEIIPALDRRYTPEQCREKQRDVASKVPIARGADIADLELGIIGYVVGQYGDSRIDYCEGGGGAAERGTPIRIGDCLQTGDRGRMRIQMNDMDTTTKAGPSHLNMSTNSLMCFNSFSVHRDDGKPGLIDFLKGTIRVITDGWNPGSGFGVNVSVKAAVIVASDVVLEYDPESDLLSSYVNEGNVEITDITSGDSLLLTDGEQLQSSPGSIGSVERMSSRDWKDLIADYGLDLEEDTGTASDPSSLAERFNLSLTALIIGGVCGGGLLLVLFAGGVILLQRKKKTDLSKIEN